eukprot:142543_1
MQLYTFIFLVLFKFESSSSYCLPITCLNSYDAECNCHSSIHRCAEEHETHLSFYWDYYNVSDCVVTGQQSDNDYRCYDVKQYGCDPKSYIKLRSYDSCNIENAGVSWWEEVESLGCAPYFGSYTDGIMSTYITCTPDSMHVVGYGSHNCEGTIKVNYKSYAGCNQNGEYLEILYCDHDNNYPDITTTIVGKANCCNSRIVLFIGIFVLNYISFL